MVQPDCIATLTSRCGLLHLFTEQALQSVIDKISVDSPEDKLDGFDIQQWAAFARKKSSIASSICKELGRLKASQSASVNIRHCGMMRTLGPESLPNWALADLSMKTILLKLAWRQLLFGKSTF